MSVTINGSGAITFNDGSVQNTASLPGMRNRIINGAMMIDQRNAGASVNTIVGGVLYTIDRFAYAVSQASKMTIQQNAGSVTPPVGFKNYLGVTSSSAYSIGAGDYFNIRQVIEGLNCADFGWGTANAATVTLSFWVRSSLTGTFGGSLFNSGNTRFYPFSYTISSANTWEQKTITIAGDTTGTWLTTNGAGISISFSLGMGSTYSGTAGSWSNSEFYSATGATSVVGTNGATFYITGVQLEKGSTATSFDYRPYGTELALCQRYYYRTSGTGRAGVGFSTSTTQARLLIQYPVTMRTAPTALEQSGTAADYTVINGSYTIVASNAVPSLDSATADSIQFLFTVASGLTLGQGAFGRLVNTAYLGWSAEL